MRMGPDDFQPEPCAKCVAQQGRQGGVIDEDVQAVGVLGEDLIQARWGRSSR